MSHLGLTSLPKEIGNLVNLETLNLFNNDLKVLPKSMAKMTKLTVMNVYDNVNLSESYKDFMPDRLWAKDKENRPVFSC